jgi:C-terminal processing protease CtpA/Prc
LYPPVDLHYSLEVMLPGATEKVTLRVAATRIVQRDSMILARYEQVPRSLEDTWQFRIMEDEIGYLKLGTFAIFNFQMDWKGFLKNAFSQLKKARTPDLIIDIRGNAGGADEVLEVLGQYLLKDYCGVKTFQSRSRYEKLPELVIPHVRTWDTSVYDLTGQVDATGQEAGFFSVGKDQKEMWYPGSKAAFKGRVFLLVDAACSSATFYLTRIAKSCNVATVVGETTGGNLRGINGGVILFLTLPNSHIEIDIPAMGDFSRTDRPDAGISPDIEFHTALEGIIQQKDSQLEQTLDLIKKER